MDISEIIASMTIEQKIRLCNGRNNWQTMPFEELGIPPLVMSDGTNGVRFQKDELIDGKPIENMYKGVVSSGFDSTCAMENTFKATCYPSGSTLACSWDTALAKEIGAAIATECKSFGIGLLLGPGMNIRRHPLTGRNNEYYSEDPVLSGEMATGMVMGIQGEGVGATVKHFICNNSDTRRTKLNCVVEERALREIYLAGFERVIKKAQPAAVMPSYPSINGTPACQNKWLLTDVLRNDWGYQGLTISDWWGVKDAVTAVVAGLDFMMPYSPWFLEKVLFAVKNGEITEEQINTHCERLLEVVFKYTRSGKEIPEVDWESHHKLAQRAAAECAVLLKNENDFLPLDPKTSQKIAVLGAYAKNPLYQGTGCAIVNSIKEDIPLEEMTKVAPNAVFRYSPGYLSDNTTNEKLLQEAKDTASAADIAIVMVGKPLPQESDEYDHPNMDLDSGHIFLLEAVLSVQPNTIIVVFNGDAINMFWGTKAKAILDMFYAGEGCGNAVAKLIFGLVNPSGKLPVSIPHNLVDTPAYLDFPHEQDISLYREGIFVGYRYYDKREIKTLYPFGFGLSYTTFSYDSIHLNKNSQGEYSVEVQITNTGNKTGAEIVQLYIKPSESHIFRPVKELKGFEKVLLAPKESTIIRFDLNRGDFAYYDNMLSRWLVNDGLYTIMIGGSSRDLPLSIDLYIKGDMDITHLLTLDSHFSDIFRSPASTMVFFEFLVEKGLLSPDQVTEEVKHNLTMSFWAFPQHLDNTILPPESMIELLERMNAALLE